MDRKINRVKRIMETHRAYYFAFMWGDMWILTEKQRAKIGLTYFACTRQEQGEFIFRVNGTWCCGTFDRNRENGKLKIHFTRVQK